MRKAVFDPKKNKFDDRVPPTRKSKSLLLWHFASAEIINRIGAKGRAAGGGRKTKRLFRGRTDSPRDHFSGERAAP